MRIKTTEIYLNWINALKDRAARARIQMRVDRLAHGNPGQHRHLEQGISEMKVDVGPGYRVYYTQRGNDFIILLVGGDKSSQQRDISTAQALARHLPES